MKNPSIRQGSPNAMKTAAVIGAATALIVTVLTLLLALGVALSHFIHWTLA